MLIGDRPVAVDLVQTRRPVKGVRVATMAVPRNAVWYSKTLQKGLKSSQNIIGNVIELYGLDLAP